MTRNAQIEFVDCEPKNALLNSFFPPSSLLIVLPSPVLFLVGWLGFGPFRFDIVSGPLMTNHSPILSKQAVDGISSRAVPRDLSMAFKSVCLGAFYRAAPLPPALALLTVALPLARPTPLPRTLRDRNMGAFLLLVVSSPLLLRSGAAAAPATPSWTTWFVLTSTCQER